MKKIVDIHLIRLGRDSWQLSVTWGNGYTFSNDITNHEGLDDALAQLAAARKLEK